MPLIIVPPTAIGQIKPLFAPDDLALYVCNEHGILEDATQVEATILNAEVSLPGIPEEAATVEWTDITVTGRFDEGCYAIPVDGGYPYPDGEGGGDSSRVRVIFRYKPHKFTAEGVEGYDWAYVERTSYIVPNAIAGMKTFEGLTTPADVRAYANESADYFVDALLVPLIYEWTKLLERVARQRFRTVRETRLLSQSGKRIFHLPEPLRLRRLFDTGGNEWALPSRGEDIPSLVVHGIEGDERHNPRIEVLNRTEGLIWTPSLTGSFSTSLRYRVSGIWGFVEDDTLEAPEPIQRAAMKGVALSARQIFSRGGYVAPGVGPVRSEQTDAHSISYGYAIAESRSGLIALLKDPEIRDAVRLYMAPVGIAAPGAETGY